MGLIICHSCGRHRNVAKIPFKVYTCSNCGARDPLIYRGKRVATLVSTADSDGVDRETARHQTYAGLLKHAEIKGYKQGFAFCKFREIYGCPPNGEQKETAQPMTHELGLWLKRSKDRFVVAQRVKEKANSTAGSLGREGRIAIQKRIAAMTMQRESLNSSKG